MVALPLLDVVLSSDSDRHKSEEVAAELIQAALNDIRHIERLDENLAPADPTDFDRQTVAIMRGMYDDWARQTEGLLDRIAPLERTGRLIAGSDELRHAHGRTRAMLSISMERLERGHRDAVAGRAIPIEEVRRGLRSGTH